MLRFDRKRILAIAGDAVKRNGFVAYADYNDYLRELIAARELEPINGGRCQWYIKDILLNVGNDPEDRYRYRKAGRRARFYPYSQDLFVEK